MGICDWPQCGLAYWCGIHLPSHISSDRCGVGRCEFHEQIVRMLPIVNLLALALFTGREQIGIPTPTNRPGLEAHHAAEPEETGPGITFGHSHRPVDASDLVITAVAGFMEIRQEHVLVEHQRP